MEDNARISTWVKVAQGLFFLNGVIWLSLGIVSLIRLASGHTAQTITMLVVAVLMFGNVAAMLLAGVGLVKPRRWTYFFAIAVLVVNILLTVTDEFGLLDLLTLILDLVLFWILIAIRKTYTARSD